MKQQKGGFCTVINTIQHREDFVKEKIRPIFNLEIKRKPSLEEIVEMGEIDRDPKGERSSRVNLPACPELVKASLVFLRRKHKNLPSLAAVCRYVTKRGLMAIEEISEIKNIEARMKQSYLSGSELDRLCFSNQTYSFENRLGFTRHAVSCYLFEWVHSGVTDVAYTLGLKATTLTTLALVFGLGKSEKWIPEPYQKIFGQEAEKFHGYIIERMRKAF